MQEPVLFNRSVYENIQYNSDKTMKQIIIATEQSRSYDFIIEGKFGIKENKFE